MKERYVLYPCSGRVRLNIPRGHIYNVKDTVLQEYLGFITEEVAKAKYGEGNYRICQSDSLCHVCSYDIHEAPKLISLTD
jgi:hypothetical protein